MTHLYQLHHMYSTVYTHLFFSLRMTLYCHTFVPCRLTPCTLQNALSLFFCPLFCQYILYSLSFWLSGCFSLIIFLSLFLSSLADTWCWGLKLPRTQRSVRGRERGGGSWWWTFHKTNRCEVFVQCLGICSTHMNIERAREVEILQSRSSSQLIIKRQWGKIQFDVCACLCVRVCCRVFSAGVKSLSWAWGVNLCLCLCIYAYGRQQCNMIFSWFISKNMFRNDQEHRLCPQDYIKYHLVCSFDVYLQYNKTMSNEYLLLCWPQGVVCIMNTGMWWGMINQICVSSSIVVSETK